MDVMRRRLVCGKGRDVTAAAAAMTLLFLIGGTSAAVDHNKVSRHRELDDDHRGHSGSSVVLGEDAGSASRTGNGRSPDTDDNYSVRCGRYRKCDLRSDWCDEALGRCMSCAEDCSPRRIGGDELAVRRCHQICSVYYRHMATATTTSSTSTTTNPSNKQQDPLNDQPDDSRRAPTALIVPDWFTATVAATLCLITAATLSLVLLVVHRYCCSHQPPQPPVEHRQLSFVGCNDKRQTTCLRGVLVVEGLTDLHQQMSAADKKKSVLVRALSDTVVIDNGSTSSVAMVTPLLGDSSSRNVSI